MRKLILIAIAFFGAHVSADMDCNRLTEDIKRLIDDGVIRDSTYLSLFKSLIGPSDWKNERAKFHVNQDKLNERYFFLATKPMNEKTCLVMGKGIIDDLHYYLEFIKKSIESIALKDLNSNAHNKIHSFEETIKAWRAAKILPPTPISVPEIKYLPQEKEQRSNASIASLYLENLKDELVKQIKEKWGAGGTKAAPLIEDSINLIILNIDALRSDIEKALKQWGPAADTKEWIKNWEKIKESINRIVNVATSEGVQTIGLLTWVDFVDKYLLRLKAD